MKIYLQIEVEVEILDAWLAECREIDPVEDQEADASSVAIGTAKEMLTFDNRSWNPVTFRVESVSRIGAPTAVEENITGLWRSTK